MMGELNGLLVNDLHRLTIYLSMTALAVAMSALGLGIVGVMFPMIGAASATYSLSISDIQSGWTTFAVSSGVERRDIVKTRLEALLVFSIPLAVIPAICSIVLNQGYFGLGEAGLGIGAYIVGVGYGCMITFSRPRESVSMLRLIAGQIAYMAVAVLILLAAEAYTGNETIGFALCLTTGIATMTWTYIESVKRFAGTDL